MTNKDLTQLLVIVDRSGSMASSKNDMIGGLDEFFKSQTEVEGECVVDYVQFDSEYEVVFTDRPVGYAKAVLEPRGATALLDAIGKGVTDLGAKLRLRKEADKPGTVIVVVVTDGYENASREWSSDTVKALIKQQEDEWNWEFTFLGANIDAVAVGQQFGFNVGNSMTYDTAYAGSTMTSLSTNVTRTRKTGESIAYAAAERAAAMGEEDSEEELTSKSS